MSKIGKINISVPEKVKVATLTFSGTEMFILPILDIKIPYKLFLHQHAAF